MKTIVLKHPIKVNGDEMTELHLDFESLTMQDLDKALAKMKVKDGISAVPSANPLFHKAVAELAAMRGDRRLAPEDLQRLSFQDGLELTKAGLLFSLIGEEEKS